MSTIGNAPSREKTTPVTTDKIPISGSQYVQLANLLKIINGLTEDTSPDNTADFILTYDNSDSSPKKVKPSTLASLAQALTNKRIDKRVASTTDDATAEIDCDSYDEYYLTAIANNTTISITGTPTAGQTIFIGLKDAGVSKTLTWTSITGLGVTLPTATTASKQHIIGLKYIASAWRAIAVAVEA